MKSHEKLHLDDLAHSIAQSLQIGIISFDNELKIIDYTPEIEKIIEMEPTLNQTLSKGTDPNVWGNWKESLLSVLETGQQADFGVIKYTRNKTPHLLHLRCIPAKTTQTGHVFGAAMIIIDTTGKLETEHELAQAERLMAIGKVAGKVAHELNNPLDGILRYVNLTLRILDQDQPEKAKEYLTHCRTGLQRMAQIITEMLEFSRSTTLAYETSPVDKLLDDALRAMESSLRYIEVKIVRDYTGSLPHMKSDSLFQIFCNLIKNAADAMAGQGKLTITISQTKNNWHIEFVDTGHGFDSGKADDLFRPFFTTKPKGRGTGLGLAICKDILEKLNGAILARNNPEGGACFTVQLPYTPHINNTRQAENDPGQKPTL